MEESGFGFTHSSYVVYFRHQVFNQFSGQNRFWFSIFKALFDVDNFRILSVLRLPCKTIQKRLPDVPNYPELDRQTQFCQTCGRSGHNNSACRNNMTHTAATLYIIRTHHCILLTFYALAKNTLRHT